MEKRKQSFSVQNSTSRSSRHNSRKEQPKYLIGSTKNNFYKKYNNYKNDAQFLKLSMENYKNKIGQRMQEVQKKAVVKEAVISLESHHTEEDIYKLFEELNKKYGGHKLLELSIHRDEGHLIDKNGETYYPNTSIFFNENDENWYLDSKFTKNTKKLNLNLKKVMNYHAHAKFTMINSDTAKTSRMAKSHYSSRHRLVAQVLEMRYAPGADRLISRNIAEVKVNYEADRGKNSQIIKKIIKLELDLKDKIKKSKKITKKDLGDLKKEYKQKMIESKLASKEDYNKLHALFIDAEEKNSEKDFKIDDLANEFSLLFDKFNNKQQKRDFETMVRENSTNNHHPDYFYEEEITIDKTEYQQLKLKANELDSLRATSNQLEHQTEKRQVNTQIDKENPLNQEIEVIKPKKRLIKKTSNKITR